MNRRDTVLLTAIQSQGDRLDLSIHALDFRLDTAVNGLNDRIDGTNARLDTVIDVLAQLRGDLTAHLADHHHHHDDD